jgi:glycosyltransferase involved in cell wall biosynthesis
MFIAPSNFLRDKFIEYGFNPEKVVHLDHFIDYPVVKEICPTEDYYLFVGRIAEEKGIKTLIDAAIRVNLSRLKIAGGGPLLDDLKEYVAKNDKSNTIEFLGHRSREDLVDLYRKAKFLVVPSEWYENSGLIIFEAFACGKPVLGSNIGGIPELVKHRERGLICNYGKVECLASAIKSLLDDPDVTTKMGENAKEYLSKNLNGSSHYTELMKIYKKVS